MALCLFISKIVPNNMYYNDWPEVNPWVSWLGENPKLSLPDDSWALYLWLHYIDAYAGKDKGSP